MTSEAELIARSVLESARQLTDEVSGGVTDIIVSNASRIPSFNSRRDELTRVEAKYLFYYLFGLVLLSRTIQASWKDRDVEPILEAAANVLSRRLAYSSGAQTDVEQIRAGVLSNARDMYEQNKSSFGRILSGKGQKDEIFDVAMLNLIRAFPGVASLMMEEPALFTTIAQRFGTLSLTAFGVSEDAMSAPQKPSRKGGFLRGLFFTQLSHIEGQCVKLAKCRWCSMFTPPGARFGALRSCLRGMPEPDRDAVIDEDVRKMAG